MSNLIVPNDIIFQYTYIAKYRFSMRIRCSYFRVKKKVPPLVLNWLTYRLNQILALL